MNRYMLQTDLISIKMKNFDVILEINLLAKENAINNCFNRKVTFKLKDYEKFAFKRRPLFNPKMIISVIQVNARY